jgi:hypothetical protein
MRIALAAALEYGFLLNQQRHRDDHGDSSLQGVVQQRTRGTGFASKSCNDDISIQNYTHNLILPYGLGDVFWLYLGIKSGSSPME